MSADDKGRWSLYGLVIAVVALMIVAWLFTLQAGCGQSSAPPFEWRGGTVNASADLPDGGKPWTPQADLRASVTGAARVFGYDVEVGAAWGSGSRIKICGQVLPLPRVCLELEP